MSGDFDIRNGEFAVLNDARKYGVRLVVARVRANGTPYSYRLEDGSEPYAWQGADWKVRWGLNAPPHDHNIARGVLNPGEQL